MVYHPRPMNAPRLSGAALKAAVALLEGPLGGPVARRSLDDMGVNGLRTQRVDAPIVPLPSLPSGPWTDRAPDLAPVVDAPCAVRGFRPETVADFARAYRSGSVSPVEVAERLGVAIDDSERHAPPLRVLIAHERDDLMRQAEASRARHESGQPLSVLDGVPVAVKDEVDMIPYPTTVGTRFLGRDRAVVDATAVARLRAMGALLFGKTNMHEIGITPSGHNAHHGQCRNPHDPSLDPGGSSSGVAAAVAAGFAPLGLGADGGGSIRIPAAFCGQVGLKPTFGRISEHGAAPLCWSVGHLGPIAATASDAAIGYVAMAGRDPHDENTLRQPTVNLDGFLDEDLRGVRLGVFRPWFEHADDGVVRAAGTMLEALVERGAEVREVTLPDLHLLQIAHVLTIVSEMRGAMLPSLPEHQRDFGVTVRMILALAGHISSSDYVQAQRVRGHFTTVFRDVLHACDVIMTPTTACTAPLVHDESLPHGASDILLIDKVMRYARPANFLGLPAVSFPAGVDEHGRPVGMQAMGRPWEEALLLKLARAAEPLVERPRPKFHRALLT